MATTTNFGWETPDDTDLVKDGAAAMRTLGSSIDTSFVDLKGGTTGQVLSKASNTDLDYTWVTTDDANAIQNAIVDAKGDLVAATANDTPARLAVGADGTSLVANSAASTGLSYEANWAAGKNKIINGDFSIWQRGTTFNAAGSGNYFADRWTCYIAGGTNNITQQTFTPGTAPVAGYEGQYFLRWTNTSAAAGLSLSQRIEDVRKFAGQTITVSFWVKANASLNTSVSIYQQFGSGGSSAVSQISDNIAVTTSWTRVFASFNVASIAGKTIGTNNYFQVDFNLPNQTFTFDIWGVQVEAGSVATAFQTATGTIQGELAACQRYYFRIVSGNTFNFYGYGNADTTNSLQVPITTPVEMRVKPTALDSSAMSTFYWFTGATNGNTATSFTISGLCQKNQAVITVTKSASFVAGAAYMLLDNGTTSAFLGFSAEL
jgi:hypothetical protein